MNNSDLNFNNIRHVSVRKKTASRICSAQVLYEETFLETNINFIIKSYMESYLPEILLGLGIKKIDLDLFNTIVFGVHNNISTIDQILSKNLAKSWSIDRLSRTEKSVLRLAIFELCFQKKFNKITIINEYISIIEIFGGDANFANGILDKISK